MTGNSVPVARSSAVQSSAQRDVACSVQVVDAQVAAVPVRVYEPQRETGQTTGQAAGLEQGIEQSPIPWATLVWAHGGSFIRGTLDWPEADWASRRFAESGIRVYSVDYALASETVKAPAPANDLAAVLSEVTARHGGPILVGGASAGAHLAAAAAVMAATRVEVAAADDQNMNSSQAESKRGPSALALIYPTLHRVQRHDPTIAALTAKLAAAKRFGPERIAQMYDFYLGTAVERGNSANLGNAANATSDVFVVGELESNRLASLPPTVIVNADADDLRASGEQFAEQLREAGVAVTQHTQPGTVHGYMNRPDESPQAQRDALATIEFMVSALRAILGEDERHQHQSRAQNSYASERSDLNTHSNGQEPKLTEPVSLTLPNGRLNREAIGWATQPLVDTSGIGRGWGRNKRWEYWNVATPSHIIGVTVSHIDYACVHEVWVYDRETGTEHHRAMTVIPPRGAVLAPRLEHGRSMARAKNLAIDIDEVGADQSGAGEGGAGDVGTDEGGVGEVTAGTRLRVEIENVSINVVAELPAGHERLAVVVPWSDTRFQYTVKDLARPARGILRIDGVAHEIGGEAGEAWAVLDHGRGRWPYDIRWNWGAGSGRSGGRVIGVQVGAKWTEGTGVSENAFFVDGRMHKIHGETVWSYDPQDWLAPWRVTGGGLDATFVPFTNKVTRTDLLVLQGYTDQCFGRWQGSFETADGEVIEFEGLLGWAEEVHNRW